MAITNYSELKTAIINWSNRSDQDLYIDDFIRLAEIEMFNHPSKSLRLRNLELRATPDTTTTSRFMALPDGFEKMRSMRINVTDSYNTLTATTPEGLYRRDTAGQPLYFAVTSQIEFDALPDEVYSIEINYYGKPAGISSSNTTNNVLTSNPDIYLFGALYKLFTRAVDMEQAATYKNMFYSAIQGANKTSRDGRFGMQPSIQVDGPTP
tara:strand:- start:9423 stop:10049 length:627 start_codon:yes stop_codon:yes gene_type:complete